MRSRLFVLAGILAACGGGDPGGGADGGGGGSDGGGIDSAGGGDGGGGDPVRVTVEDEGQPVPGLTAVFLAPDGTELLRRVTDDLGQVIADVAAGTTVTVLDEDGAGLPRWSVTGLEPGDDIHLGLPFAYGQPIGTMTISFPAHTGESSYVIRQPCGDWAATTTSGGVYLSQACGPDPLDVLVEHQASGDFVIAHDIPFEDGGAISIPGNASAWQPARPLDVALVGTEDQLTDTYLQMFVESNGTDIMEAAYTGTIDQRRYIVPPGWGAMTRAHLWRGRDESDTSWHPEVTSDRVVAGAPDELTIDLAAPWFLPAMERFPGLDLQRSAVEIVVGDGDSWDMTNVILETEIDGQTYTWFIAAPGGPLVEFGNLLPPELAHRGLQRDDTATASVTLVAVDGDAGDLRHRPERPRDAIESARPGAPYILRTSTIVID